MPRIFRIAQWTAIISFVMGSLIFFSYYQNPKDNILFLGYAYISLAILINLIVLIMVIAHGIKNKGDRKKAIILSSIQLANIPIAIIYFIAVMNLLSIMRITLINPTNRQITEIHIEGCEEVHINAIQPGSSKTIWIHVKSDCSIYMNYNMNGLKQEATIMEYCTPNMGQKLTYRIGEKSTPLF